MKTLVVGLGDRAYPLHIGQNLLGRADLFSSVVRGSQVMLVTNETIASLYLPALQRTLQSAGIPQVDHVVLPDGESFKTLSMVERIVDALLEKQHNRRTTLVALGGGVIGDMTGFAAACYQRGVSFIQVPTTLLAQVDSSVGGKTGVNHPRGKNMIGAFHQPLSVVIDVDTLSTLPEREFRAGLAEVIKYGLIRDSAFFGWLETNIAALMARNKDCLVEAIARSCANKAAIVEADEREEGVRATLNLGHTFGHAIETGAGYGVWLHGEAVAAGIIMAMDLSVRLGFLADSQRMRAVQLIGSAGLPLRPPPMDPERFIDYMRVDKKNVNGRIRLVLLRDIGDSIVTDEFSHDLLRETLVRHLCEG